MKDFFTTLRWTARQHWWLAPLALAVLIGAGWGAAALGKPAYVRWRTARAVTRARQSMTAQDLPRAEVALEVALRGPPGLDTYRLLADYYEAIGARQAVDARRLAVQARPEDAGLKLDLARTALRFSNLPEARDALESVPAGQRGTIEYRRLDASAALLAGDGAKARGILGALHGDAPDDAGIRFLNDSLLVRSQSRIEAERARLDLEELAQEPGQRVGAERVLLADAVSRGDAFGAAAAGRELAAAAGSSYADLLDAVSAEKLSSSRHEADPALVARVRSQAAADPSLAAQYGRRLLLEEGTSATSSWLRSLPAAIAQSPSLREVWAECAAAQGDWGSLQSQLAHGAWGEVASPVLDLAFGARAARAGGQAELAARTWAEAIAACAGSPTAFRTLNRLADIWRWPDGMEQALRAELRVFPDDDKAAQRLIGLLRVRGETRTLAAVLAERNAARPATDRQVADWALLDVLVHPPAASTASTRALEILRLKSPRDPFIATDWALVLCDLGRPKQAAAIADALTPDERAAPARGPYLAFIYASAGRTEDAQRAALRSPPASQLLPEEAALLRRVR